VKSLLIRALAAALPLLTYPLWSRLLFYRPLRAAVLVSAGLAVILLWDRVPWKRLLDRPDWLKACAIGLAAYVLYAAAALGVFGPVMEPTGDEPNYLLATISLLRDGDIRLKNNFTRRDYLDFYPGRIVTRVVQGRDRGGYPVHGVGVSVYLLPFYYIGSTIGGSFAVRTAVRLGMALIAAALAGALYILLRRSGTESAPAAATAGILTASPPLLFYAHLVYPETSVALIFTLFLIALLSSPPRWALCGLLLSLCPWFGVKFNALAAGLAGTVLIGIWMKEQPGRRFRSLAAAFLAALPSALLYEAYLWRFYGSFSPAAATGGRAAGDKDSVTGNLLHYFSYDTVKRLRFMPQTFLADLIDQKGGILLYSPALVIALLGIWILIRERNRIGLYLLLAPALHLGIYTYTNYMGGYCPPGRPVMPLLPVAAILLAAGLREWRNVFTRSLLLFMTAAISTVWLGANSLFYHRLTYDEARLVANFALFIDAPSFRLTDLLPVLTWAGGVEWLPVLLTTAAILALLLTSRLRVSGTIAEGGALAVVFILVILVARTPAVCQRVPIGTVEMQFLDGWPAYPEENGFWLKGSRSGRAWIVSATPLRRVVFSIWDAHGFSVESDGREFGPDGAGDRITVDLTPSNTAVPFVHPISIRVAGGFRPSEREKDSRDERWLGVFVSGVTGDPSE